jgi:hypothetical protein
MNGCARKAPRVTKRIRLIGLDLKKTDRDTGVSTSESTNYSNGKRITESLRYDEAKKKDVTYAFDRAANDPCLPRHRAAGTGWRSGE